MELTNSTVMVVAGAAPFSTRDVWEGYVEGLQEIGVNVLPYPTFSMLTLLSPELMGNDLIGKAIDIRNGVDAVVFIDGLYFRNERRWVVESLTRQGILTVMIPTDDPYHPLPAGDNVYRVRFTNERSLQNDSLPYLPTATLPPPALPQVAPVRDLIFVGTMFADRWKVIRPIAEYCEQHAIRFDLFGHFTIPPGNVGQFEHVQIHHETVDSHSKWEEYARSKAVLNVFRTHEPSPESASPRIYEVAALGGPALISDRRPELCELFGECTYLFDNIEQFGEQLQRLLSNESERQQRVERAAHVANEGHLYSHRSRRLMAELSFVVEADSVQSAPVS